MKRILRILGIGVLSLAVIFGIIFLITNKPLPEGKQGSEAEALTDKIFATLDKAAWDTTCWVQWDYIGGHSYLWDKSRGFCEVKWGNKRVLLNTTSLSGIAYEKGQEVTDNKQQKLLKKAWAFFANDSFWLIAPFKLRDSGTERRLVKLEDGTDALLVTYTSGGVTPGDSYLWKVNEAGLPTTFQMWVKIIPIGGLAFGWEDWQELPTGALIAENHTSSLFSTKIKNLKSAQTWEAMGLERDIFEAL